MRTVDPVKHDIMAGLRSTKWPELLQHTRIQRKVEKQRFHRWLAETPEVQQRGLIFFPFDPYDVYENDEQDCQHGCNGDCKTSDHGSERCTFMCHEGLI
jgi:hypothetical protein